MRNKTFDASRVSWPLYLKPLIASDGNTFACNCSANDDCMGEGMDGSDMAEIANSPDFHKGMGQQFIEIAMGNLQGDSAVVQGMAAQQVTPEMIAINAQDTVAGGRFGSRSRPVANDWAWEVVA